MADAAARRWWRVFLVVAAVHLAAQAAGIGVLQTVTKPLLMPALALWAATSMPASRLRTLLLVALGWSWLGDVALMPGGGTWFLLGLGAFLLAQLTYAGAFWPYRQHSLLATPVRVLPYLVLLVGLPAVLWGDLGALRVPVAVYATVIVSMAVLATGLNRATGIGAGLFVLSDALIAAGSVTAALRLPVHDLWVMLTYLAAQGLLAQGIRAGALRGPQRRDLHVR
ncbi:MAG: lysoplasmalogenase [Nitriliruptoraceae bacterium]